DEAGKRMRCAHRKQPAVADRFEAYHLTDTIDMATDQMSAKTVGKRQCLFQSDRAQAVETYRAGQGFLRYVHLERIALQADGGETDAIDGDAVTDGDVGQVEGPAVDQQPRIVVQRQDLPDFANGLYDSGKHSVILAGNPDELRICAAETNCVPAGQ